MLDIIYGEQHAALAKRLDTDLRNAPLEMVETDESQRVVVAIIGPEYDTDAELRGTVEAALSRGDYVVPVLTGGATAPESLKAVPALDFNTAYDSGLLMQHITRLTQQQQDFPLRLAASSARRRNRIAGAVLAVMAIFMFGVAVWGITSGLVGFPEEEFEQVETEFAQTLDALVNANLPGNPTERAAFPLTVDAAPTGQQPFLVETATALWSGSANATPSPTPSE